MIDDLDRRHGEAGDAALQIPLADVAPRAGDVGPDIDPDRRVVGSHHRKLLRPVSVPAGSYVEAMRECTVEGCERLAYTRGLCQMHYRRVLGTGGAGPPGSLKQRRKCSVIGCDRQVDARDLCHGHYRRLLVTARRTGKRTPEVLRSPLLRAGLRQTTQGAGILPGAWQAVRSYRGS